MSNRQQRRHPTHHALPYLVPSGEKVPHEKVAEDKFRQKVSMKGYHRKGSKQSKGKKR